MVFRISGNNYIFPRSGQIEEALAFAQSQMSEAGENNPEVLSELERTLALLAFEKPQNSPFADLLDQSHRIVSESNLSKGKYYYTASFAIRRKSPVS